LAQNGNLNFDFPNAEVKASEIFTLAATATDQFNGTILTDTEFRQHERDNMLAALNKAHWKIHGPGGAAELLGLKPTTLISRAKKLGLKKPATGSVFETNLLQTH